MFLPHFLLLIFATAPRCFASEGAHSTGLLNLVNCNLLKTSIIINFVLKWPYFMGFQTFRFVILLAKARILQGQ